MILVDETIGPDAGLMTVTRSHSRRIWFVAPLVHPHVFGLALPLLVGHYSGHDSISEIVTDTHGLLE